MSDSMFDSEDDDVNTPITNSIGEAAKPLVVGFIGLPSAGKSSLINSLVGKRILQSGLCRTTTEVHLIGPTNEFGFPNERYHQHSVQSDDGVPITILDLPGVADAENKGTETNFDELTRAHVTNCDLIFWVSDVQTAFLTTHERNEFEGINALLKQTTTETGTLYQIGILISKYNYGDTQSEPLTETKDEITGDEITGDDDEITSDDEDTTVHDCYRRVEHIFKNSNIPLFKYNAFGRILASNDKGTPLVRLVQKTGVGALSVNTEFNLKWATDELDDKQQLARLISLLTYHFPNFLSHNCRHGYALHQDSCTKPGYCDCANPCTCYCEYHGSCQGGAPKYLSATCSSATCKFHRTDRCFYGKQLEEKCVHHCPQHARHSCSSASKIARKITSHKALALLLDFLLIADEKGRENFNTTSAQIGMGPIMAYDASHWSSFVQCLGRLPALCPLVEKQGQAILHQRSTLILHRLTKLLGPDFHPVARLYLLCTSVGNVDGAAAPKTLKAVDPEKHPQFFQLDIDFQTDRVVSCRTDWLARVRNARVQLWGDGAEEHVDLHMVLMNVWHGNLQSILAAIP
jgi:hypothetical protein